MEKCSTGSNCLNGMPLIGLGTYAPRKDDEKIHKAVKHAVRNGYRLLDCAAIYRNEMTVGHAVKELITEGTIVRKDLFIISKLWNSCHSAELVRPSLKKTLYDLGLRYLDLYLIHWPMGYKEGGELEPKDDAGNCLYSDVDFIDTWKAMEDCVDEGLTKHIGVSNFNSKQLTRILDIARIKPFNQQWHLTTLQQPRSYHVNDRFTGGGSQSTRREPPCSNGHWPAPECPPTQCTGQVEVNLHHQNTKLIEFCKSENIIVTAYCPFGVSTLNESLEPIPLLKEPLLQELATRKNKTPAQVALRFLIQRGICVVPKSVTPSRITENIQIFDFELTDEEMKELASLDQNRRSRPFSHAKDHKEYPFNEPF